MALIRINATYTRKKRKASLEAKRGSRNISQGGPGPKLFSVIFTETEWSKRAIIGPLAKPI